MVKKCAIFLFILCMAGFLGEMIFFKANALHGEKKVIRLGIAGWQKGELPWEETIANYEKKYNVDIQLNIVPGGTETSLLFYWSNGVTPFDVICSLADEEIHPFIKKELLVDFREKLTKEQFEDLVPATLAGSTVAGIDGKKKTYCLPYQCEFMVMNYRKDIFAEYGITKLPKTWEEMEKVAEKIKGCKFRDKLVAPLSMDFSSRVFFGQNCFIPLLAEYKNGKITDSRGRLDIYGPETVKIFKILKDWLKRGLVSSSALNGKQEDEFLGGMGAVFCHWQSRGKNAMLQLEGGKDKIGFGPVPGSQQAGALVSCYGAIIPKCSPVVDEAVKFCYEAFTTDMQPAVAKSGTLPCVKSMYKEDKVEPWMLDIYDMLDKGYSFPDPETWPRVRKTLGLAFHKYANDQMSAEEAAEWARKKINEFYSKED